MEKADYYEMEVPIDIIECRICQEADFKIKMEVPCACLGSLKYAHRACIQKWCEEKKNITCEICNKTFAPDYSVTPPPTQPEHTTDTSNNNIDWHVSVPDGARGNLTHWPWDQARLSLLTQATDSDDDDDDDEDGEAERNKAACGKGSIFCWGLYLLMIGVELAGLVYLRSKFSSEPSTPAVCQQIHVFPKSNKGRLQATIK